MNCAPAIYDTDDTDDSGGTGTGPVGGGGAGSGVQLTDPLSGKNFAQIAASIISFIITIAIPLTAILVLWGGFQMITAAGNPEKFSAGKKTILYAVIGFAVVLLADGVVALIKSLLDVQ